MAERALDLRGLKCPLPALKVGRALRTLEPDDVLAVACTDPMAALDIPNLCRETGDRLEETRRDGAGTLHFRIRKAPIGPVPE